MCSCCSPSNWHKIDKTIINKPKIEVIRVPSVEQAKIVHIIEGGIQLQAKFKHVRCNNYVSCNSLDENITYEQTNTSKYPLRISCYSTAQRSAALATKSCDNIYSKHVRITDPHLNQWTPLRWKDDSTRSAEILCQNTNANISTRSRILAFFKKLSPRPKRSNRNKTRTISGQSLFLYDLDTKTSNEDDEEEIKSGIFGSDHSLLFEKISHHKTFDKSTANMKVRNPVNKLPTILINRGEKTLEIDNINQCVPSDSGTVLGVLSPAQRPHSLHVASSHLPRPLQKTLTHAQTPGAMASSVESIGTCSLDVEHTVSDISDSSGISVSGGGDRTIPSSLPLATGNSQQATCGPSTPEYVKRTARLFESPTEEKNTTLSPNIVVDNTTQNDQFLQVPGKKPSYLGLACSISGYSGITTYDSKLREGFRSREHSPCRIPIGKETSPSGMRPDGDGPITTMPSTADINGNAFLSSPSPSSSFNSRLINGHSHENGHPTVISGGGAVSSSSSSTTGSACSNGTAIRVTHLNGSASHREITTATISTSPTTTTKSFIQQRVERLYGPGALAQGFFRRTRHSTSHDTPQKQRNGFSTYSHNSQSSSSSIITTTTTSPAPALPVLRHLRPEFAAQLSLGTSRSNTPVVSPKEEVVRQCVKQQLSVESITESLSDLQPAAPEVILPTSTPTPISIPPLVIQHQEKKDGHYFLNLLKSEINRINVLVNKVEDELTAAVEGDIPLPEEALGKLRAASGQARLLVRQKLQQFEGLCQKNISQEEGEPFPTTSEDLAGFWDMVKLQINHVDKLFLEIEKLRIAGWSKESLDAADELDATTPTTSRTIQTQSSLKRRQGPVINQHPVNCKLASARRARDEARRKMMEERRRAMKESQQQKQEHLKTNNSSVEIYVNLQENGK